MLPVALTRLLSCAVLGVVALSAAEARADLGPGKPAPAPAPVPVPVLAPAPVPAAAAAPAPAPAPVPVPVPAAPTPVVAKPVAAPPSSGSCRPGLAPIALRSPAAVWQVSPCHGGLQAVQLLSPQFAVAARPVPTGAPAWAHGKFAAGPLDLVETWDARWDPFHVALVQADVAPAAVREKAADGTMTAIAHKSLAEFYKADPRWGVVAQSADRVTLVWPDPARVQSPLYLIKQFSVDKEAGNHALRLDIAAWNAGDKPVQFKWSQAVTSFQDPGVESGGMLAMFSAPPDLKGAGFAAGEEVKHLDAPSLASADPEDRESIAKPLWLGTDSRYFLLAAAPVSGFGDQNDLRIRAVGNGVVEASLQTALQTLPAGGGCVPAWYAAAWGGTSCDAALQKLGLQGESTLLTKEQAIAAASKDSAAAKLLTDRSTAVWTLSLYTGPKDLDLLRPFGHDLEGAIDFGWFSVIAKPMVTVLNLGHTYTGSWPIAILLLTLLVKILLWPVTIKSIRSMKAMQQLKPELDAVKADLEAKAKKTGQPTDPQEVNRLTFELYKKHGVNPVGGCLPMLLQMPVYIALYRSINSSVQLFNQPLFGWIADMTQKDPYYVLPLVLGVVMFGQQKVTPQTAGDPAQQKMMLYFMPVLFTVMMLQLPSGLTLYILINTVLSVAQTLIVQRTDVGVVKKPA